MASRNLSRARWRAAFLLTGIILCAQITSAQTPTPFRPPATPLVTHTPYFSVWDMSDTTTGDWSKHWTGAVQAMCGLIRIDGKAYRYMGPQPDAAPAMKQTDLEVTPTRTTYRMTGGGIDLTLTFLSPLLPRNLEVLSRPVTYVTWQAKSSDGRSHQVALYADYTGEWAVNTPDQKINWTRAAGGDLTIGRCGTLDQPVLARKGDNVRIDWGCLYVAIPHGAATEAGVTGENKGDKEPTGKSFHVIADDKTARTHFIQDGMLPARDDTNLPRAARDNWPVFATVFELGAVETRPVSRHLLLAYDEVYSIELMGQQLRPYWRRNGQQPEALLRTAESDYRKLTEECRRFDDTLMADLTRMGGAKYAQLCALAYRQCLAANELAADQNGRPLQFPKENFSNGCISTVDVLYPAAPFFLLLNPELLKAQLTPRAGLCGFLPVEVPLCASRPRHVSACEWPGLRWRRTRRARPDAGRGDWQHAADARRDGKDRRQRRLCRTLLAAAYAVGAVSAG